MALEQNFKPKSKEKKLLIALYLQVHLHQIGVVENGICPICNTDSMDGQHLIRCLDFIDLPRNTSYLYWEARHRKASLDWRLIK